MNIYRLLSILIITGHYTSVSAQLRPVSPHQPVIITAVLVNGKPAGMAAPMHFNHDISSIQIHYRSALTQPVYRYALSNAPAVSTSDSVAVFYNLTPGQYEFRIEVSPDGKYWDGVVQQLPFTIDQPFWKKTWFIFAITLAGSLGAVILLVSIITALLFYYRFQKGQKNELILKNSMLQSEIKALRSQMNPHFIFNALNSIQHFMFTNRKAEANEYLSAFSGLIRMTLEHSQINFISIADEIKFLSTYMKLEQLRLNHLLQYSISSDPALLINQQQLPSMLLQPIVENAIIHGIAKKKSTGMINIHFGLAEGSVTCTIEDNGVGLPPSFDCNQLRAKENGHRSFGLRAIRERIAVINKVYQTDIRFTIENILPDAFRVTGTRTCFCFAGKPESYLQIQ